MEKKMENDMETGGVWGFRKLNLSDYIGEIISIHVYIYIYVYIYIHIPYGNLI